MCIVSCLWILEAWESPSFLKGDILCRYLSVCTCVLDIIKSFDLKWTVVHSSNIWYYSRLSRVVLSSPVPSHFFTGFFPDFPKQRDQKQVVLSWSRHSGSAVQSRLVLSWPKQDRERRPLVIKQIMLKPKNPFPIKLKRIFFFSMSQHLFFSIFFWPLHLQALDWHYSHKLIN